MWYVIQVAAGEENKICERCKNIFCATSFYDVFVPMYIQSKKFKGVWQEETKILFPGYVFIDTDYPEIVEEELSHLTCLAKPVYIGGEFASLKEMEQKFLAEMMDDDYTIGMSVGCIVDGRLNVLQGPLSDKGNLVCRIDRHKRIAELSFDFLGADKHAVIGLEVVAKVSGNEFEKMMAAKRLSNKMMQVAQ